MHFLKWMFLRNSSLVQEVGGQLLLLVMVSHTFLQVLSRMVFFFKQTQVNHGNKPNQINLKLIKQSQ